MESVYCVHDWSFPIEMSDREKLYLIRVCWRCRGRWVDGDKEPEVVVARIGGESGEGVLSDEV